ncbi:hypothetical protein [Variovorax sp. DXTD-1]|uniref:hypothetical protein n=1 Tax=Variovorax sp. DXTD-1 TaxID=2495592 RepID=UPI000F865EB0|nr:hypothetical protein [Variovorax sp. DXTD-1]RST50546.1 hypothetical protein EJI00_11850 [Variovorax sp. DXTD-1]
MRRFSVAVSDDLFRRIDAIAEFKGRSGRSWNYGRPWSRDRTAAWLIEEGVRLLEELNQLPADPAASGSSPRSLNQVVDKR